MRVNETKSVDQKNNVQDKDGRMIISSLLLDTMCWGDGPCGIMMDTTTFVGKGSTREYDFRCDGSTF